MKTEQVIGPFGNLREEPIFGEWKKSYVDEEYISGVGVKTEQVIGPFGNCQRRTDFGAWN